APLIDSVAQLLTVMARRKGLEMRATIAAGTPAGWRGDADRIRQILLNLVGNAVKFTERGEVSVTVSAPAGKLRLEVRDTGPGIPLDRQPTIFEPFNRGDLTQVRRTEGTGLGLAIVRRLAEAMGGTATVSSVPGAGSCFAVELALPVVPEGELPKLAAPSAPSAKAPIPLRVLLADDDALSRKVTQAQLVQYGCEVESVADGASVLPRLAAAAFDVVVLDGQMPGLDGWEVAAKLHEPAVVLAGRLPRVVALSADLTPQTLARWHAAGVPHVVAKPARLDDLARALTAAVS
nr:response regulator [Opitutaceae bacterium]